MPGEPANIPNGDGILNGVCSNAGLLIKNQILNNRKRYYPKIGDRVVGIIISKHAEFYKVDINSTQYAILDLCAFENASKRNRPNLKQGAVIYCRIVANDVDFEPELECMNDDGKSDGLGELVGGSVFNCTIRMAKSLNQKNPILQAAASIGEFEIVPGANGRVFVKAQLLKLQILLHNLIINGDTLDSTSTNQLIKSELDKYPGR